MGKAGTGLNLAEILRPVRGDVLEASHHNNVSLTLGR